MSIESIESIEYYDPNGILIARRINGELFEATDFEIENCPFFFTKQVMTREAYEAVWGKKKKHK